MSAQQLITEHIDLWTSTVKAKKTQGRGSNKKRELYGIKKLRELILELAVRGKLVPQDPNDEPANVLLERIAAEKSQLIKDKKVKKQKPLLAVTKEEMTFVLPGGWEWCRLGDLFNSIISGGTPSKRESTYWGGDIPWASVKDLGKERYIYKTQDYITQEGLDVGSKLADKDDVLICTRMGLGKIAIAATPIAINQDLKAVKLTTCLNMDFFLNTYSTIKIVGTGTTVAGIKQEELLSYVVALPPLEEQHRIAAKVDELMALCDQLEQQTESSLDAHNLLVDTLLSTLTEARDAKELSDNWARMADHFDTLITTDYAVEQLKQTILQLAVQGKLVPQDPNDDPASELLKKVTNDRTKLINEGKIKKQKPLPEINDEEVSFNSPDGWVWSRMGYLAQYQKGYAFKSKDYLDCGLMITKIQNLTENHIQNSVYIAPERALEFAQYLLFEGDIVMTTVGSWFSAPISAVGRSFLVKKLFDNSLLNQNAVRIRSWKELDPMYLFACINSSIFKNYLVQEAQGTANQASITQESIKNFLICVPPKEEQHRIVAKVYELMTVCDQLKGHINDAQTTQLHLSDAVVENALTA